MRTLRRASTGYLLRHPWQLGLALAGIAIGVAVMVAVDIANASASTAFRLSMEAITGKATHQVVGGPDGLADEVYVDLRVRHGIDRLAPVIDGYVDIGGETLSVLGIDPFAERDFRRYTLPADTGTGDGDLLATLLTRPGSVLVAAETADRFGLEIGQPVPVIAGGRTFEAVPVGLLPGGAGSGNLRGLLVTDIATAMAWFDRDGKLSRIDAAPADAAAEETIAAALPPGARLLNAAGRTRAMAEMSRAFTTNLTAMSLLALLVGVFLIYNSVSFAVLQRRGLLAMLRALGLTRRQVLGLVLGEAVVLGIAGSLAGLAAGAWLGQELVDLVSRSINDLYFRVAVTDVVLAPATLARGLGAGVSCTLLAAAVPALEAAASPPRLAMHRASLEERTGRMLPGLALAGIGLAAVSWPVLSLSSQGLVAGLVALFLLVLGLSLCVPWLLRCSVGLLAVLAGAALGSRARFVVAGIGSTLSRTGVAVVALAVAVSASVGVSIMVDSFRAAVSDWLDDTLQADLYVSPRDGEFAPSLAGSLAGVAGVRNASSSRRVWLESAAGRTRLIALEMAPQSYAGTDLLDADPETVWPAFEQEGAVLVSEPYAYRHGVGRGDAVSLATDRGERAFRIAAVYRSYDAHPESILMSRAIYDTFWDDRRVDGIGLYLEEDANPAAVESALVAVAGDRALSVRSSAELKSLSLDIFDRTFVITDVLYWLAVGVAIVGILAAMLAVQLERGRELATLRALGVTRLEVGGLVTVQSGLLGAFAGVAALPLGLLMAVMLIEVINRRAFGWSMAVSIDGGILVTALSLATASALAAGLYPAWRTARSLPAQAIREE